MMQEGIIKEDSGRILLTRFLSFLAFFAILGSIALILNGMYEHSSTYDEHFHIAWSENLYNDQNPSRSEVLNYHSTMPVTQINVLSRDILTPIFGENLRHFLTRFPQLFWYLGLLLFTFLVAKRLWGLPVALVAIIFCALDVQLLSHATVVGTDIPFATSTLVLLYCLFCWLEKPSFLRVLLLSFATALLLLSKAAALFVLPVLFLGILYLFICSIIGRDKKAIPPLMLSFQIIVLSVATLFLIAFAYHFKDMFEPLQEITFYSKPFKQLAGYLPTIGLPLPTAQLEMYDTCISMDNTQSWMTILFFEWFPKGVWFYFPLVWSFKTPILLIFVTIFGICFLAHHPFLQRTAKDFLKDNLFFRILFILQSLIFLVYFVFFFHTQVGYRYFLMFNPFLYIFAAIGFYSFYRTRQRSGFIAIFLIIAVSHFSIIPYYGNLFAYSNVLVSDKKNAMYYLNDSNLNWGQVSYGKLQEEREKRGLLDSPLDPFHIQPGKNIFDVNTLVGIWRNYDQHRWVRENLEPADHLHYVYLLYDVDQETFTRFLNKERALSSVKIDESECARIEQGVFGERVEFSLHSEHHRLCISVQKPFLFLLGSSISGFSLKSEQTENNWKDWGYIKPKQNAWFLLKPGKYLLEAYLDNSGAKIQGIFLDPDQNHLESQQLYLQNE